MANTDDTKPAAPPETHPALPEPLTGIMGRGIQMLPHLIPGFGWLVRLGFAAIVLTILWQAISISPVAIYRWFVPPAGQIFVDSPEVYTRERLINERSSEESWLNEKLMQADSPEALAGITRFIEQQLQLGGGSADVPAPKPAEKKPDDKPTGPGEPQPPQISPGVLSFDQRIRIESANRDLILQKIVENRLDDRHDLDGNSLYIMKFDTTVIVNDHSKRRALVRIGLEPPFGKETPPRRSAAVDGATGVPNQGGPNIFAAAIESGPDTVEFMRHSFELFLRNSTRRVNAAIATALQNKELGRDNLDDIKSAILQEFAIDDNEVRVFPEQELRKGQSPRTIFALSIKLLDNFLTFKASQPNIGPFEPWNFRAQDQTIAFELVEPACGRPKEIARLTPTLQSMSEIDIKSSPRLGAFLLRGNTSGSTAARLYTPREGYVLSSSESQAHFMRLLEDAMTGSERDGGYASNALLWLNFRESDLVENDVQQFESSTATSCRSITGTVRTGLMNFISRVSRFNNYAYSVLPRQSPVAIIDDVIETIVARLPDESGPLDFLSSRKSRTRGAKLQSRVTSFGDLTDGSTAESGGLSVGWIIDPLAGRTGAPQDLMVSTADSVMAIVSVPSWWPSIDVRISRSWLEPDGKTASLTDVDGGTPSPSRVYSINLPSSQHLLESTLVDNSFRKPRLDSVYCETEKDKPNSVNPVAQDCIIAGARLWRNPVVLLGAVRHKSLTVLPNMDGLLVEFPVEADPCHAPLSIWTSEGVAQESQLQLAARCFGAKPAAAQTSNGGP